MKGLQQRTEEITTVDLLEIPVFHVSVSGLDNMGEYLQPQHGESLAAAKQMQAGVCVVARAE